MNSGVIKDHDDLTRDRFQYVLEKRHDPRAFDTPND